MKTFQVVAARWLGAGMLGAMLAGGVQADSHGEKQDIVDTAVAAGQFETLAAALEAADLVETLKGDGPFTVFAPTDEAFAALPEGTVDELLEPENREQLAAVLTYHVVSGKVMAEDAMGLDSATTVQGQDISISSSDGSVMINDANVIQADIEASNGVIHVIDSVLIPE
ncbi:fasciclin domain-containing protein [Billgrantia lactosivorans]|uniref:fasciclin domain-containing protein n=1 Tax=Billgrantia lactosivorans TaxID=2185141 RepID=UPI000DADBE28|nr:fasciclin domain-containing protein [Halomonas lactosivorans]